MSSERFFLCKEAFDIQKEKNLLMQVRAMNRIVERRKKGGDCKVEKEDESVIKYVLYNMR